MEIEKAAAQLASCLFINAKPVFLPFCCGGHASKKDLAARRLNILTAIINFFCKIRYNQEQSGFFFLRITFLKVVKDISMQYKKHL